MTTRRTIVFSAHAGPALLLLYGLCRMVDGLDGVRGPGVAWNTGHALFFLAIVSFAVLTVAGRRLVPAGAPWQRVAANGAVAAGLAGAGCFLWVILGDLFQRFGDELPLPGPLQAAGPLMFQVGQLTLLVWLVAARRLPPWSPLLVLAGFALITADLDLLPLAAVVLWCGLFPLARGAGRGQSPSDLQGREPSSLT